MKVLLSLVLVLHSFVIVRASVYNDKFEGRQMANGEVFRQTGLTVASNDYNLGTRLKLTNTKWPHHVAYVTCTDRMRFDSHIDLSAAVARKLGIHGTGTVMIEVMN